MKFEQHGTIPNWEHKILCKGCGGTITLESAEDMHAEWHIKGTLNGMDYGSRTYHCICPQCKTKNQIATRHIKDDIRKKVKLKYI